MFYLIYDTHISAYDFPINENGGDTFFWNDDDCNKTFRFVCEAYTEKYHKPVDKWLPSGQPTTAGCQNGWTKYAGGCYRSSLQKHTIVACFEKTFWNSKKDILVTITRVILTERS